MKARDLMKALADVDPEAPVGFAHPAHDHWHTTVVSGVKSVGDEHVRWSEYHSSLTLPKSLDDDDDDRDVVVVVLK